MYVIHKFLEIGNLFVLFTIVAVFSGLCFKFFGGRRDSGKNQ